MSYTESNPKESDQYSASAELNSRDGSAHSLRAAFASLTAPMTLIEERIVSLLRADAEILCDISKYLMQLGGKRVRPLMTLLAADAVNPEKRPDAIISVAAGIELIHMATLLHDDIIDGSPLRRRSISPFKKYGLAPTLLSGDFLLVRAFGLCASLGSFVVENTEQACVELTEGEVLEGRLGAGRQVTLNEYINVVSKKTASLFWLATKLGTHLAGTDASIVSLATQFGLSAGITFQMADDILDVCGTEDQIGKPRGIDLRQGTPSLPNILWHQSGDMRAINFFNLENPGPDDVYDALVILMEEGHIDESRRVAKEWGERSLSLLSDLEKYLPGKEALNSLATIINYSLSRSE